MQIVTRAQARRQGLKRYFTGRPCKHGHVAEHDLNGGCIECRRERDAEWSRANPAKVTAKRRRRYLREPPEIRRAKKKAWEAAHPDANRKYCKEKYWRNPAKARANGLAWKKANKDRHLASVREWQLANPEKFKFTLIRSKHRRRTRINAGGGEYDKQDIQRILRYQRGLCAYCKKPIKQKFHIDHIIAVANGGNNDAKNLQLCCKSCNSRKGKRDPIEFAQSLGLLI